ncbi:MAG: hypothetical protein LBQ27_06060, partial [Clostridiales bacterium]|nr:hypothetical protein [Clostridiales bacterium]
GFRSTYFSNDSQSKIKTYTTYDHSDNGYYGTPSGYISDGNSSRAPAEYTQGKATITTSAQQYSPEEIAEKQRVQASSMQVLYKEARPERAENTTQSAQTAGNGIYGFEPGYVNGVYDAYQKNSGALKVGDNYTNNGGARIGGAGIGQRPEFYVTRVLVEKGQRAEYGAPYAARGMNISAHTGNATAANGVGEADRYNYGKGDFKVVEQDEQSVYKTYTQTAEKEIREQIWREHERKINPSSYEERADYVRKVVSENKNDRAFEPDMDYQTAQMLQRMQQGEKQSARYGAQVSKPVIVDRPRFAGEYIETVEAKGLKDSYIVTPRENRAYIYSENTRRTAFDTDEDFEDYGRTVSFTAGGESAVKRPSKIRNLFSSLFKRKDGDGGKTELTGLGKFVIAVYVVLVGALAIFILSNQNGSL